MNAKELIAAASELVQKPCYTCESKALAQHFLATVREDDDEPATASEIVDSLKKITPTILEWCDVSSQNGTAHIGLECYVKIKTQRDLRNLLNLLGANQ